MIDCAKIVREVWLPIQNDTAMLIINEAIEQWVFDNPTLCRPLQLDDHDWDTLFAIADILRV